MHTRPRFTYANVVATIALVLSLGGTATAVTMVSSAAITDNTIVSRDVRDRGLQSRDLSVAAQNELKGARAYAKMSQTGSSVKFVRKATRKFVKVTRMSTGDYCLTAAPGISSATHPFVVSADVGTSAGSTPQAVNAGPIAGCLAPKFHVQTFGYNEDTSSTDFSGSVAFDIIVG